MLVKELRKALAKIPTEYDDAVVYAYSDINESADIVGNIKVYNKNTFEASYGDGTPDCDGDAPWDLVKIKNGNWVNEGWKGTPAFVVIG